MSSLSVVDPDFLTWSEPDPKSFPVRVPAPDLHPETISDHVYDIKICIISANLYLIVAKLVVEYHIHTVFT